MNMYTYTNSGVSTVGSSEAYAPLTFSLFNFILNKHVAYLSFSCYIHANNLEVVAMLCSHKSIFCVGH